MTDIPDEDFACAETLYENLNVTGSIETPVSMDERLQDIANIARAVLSEREAFKSRARAAWIAGRDAALRAIENNDYAGTSTYGQLCACINSVGALEPPAEFGPDETEALRAEVTRLKDIAKSFELKVTFDQTVIKNFSNKVTEFHETLTEICDAGLIYWEPQTKRGLVSKAEMLLRVDAVLGRDSRKALTSDLIKHMANEPVVRTAIHDPTMYERTIATLRTQLAEHKALLREARDKGLIYWEPNTERGYIAKAQMIARIDAALGQEDEA